MRRTLAVVAALLLAPAPAGAATAWSRPVDGPVVRPFQPPAGRFGPGHRGVDYAVPPGTAVRAAGAGLVVFAGRVAGGLHVMVGHPGGLRTGYSFLSRVVVQAGDELEPGAVVGYSGGTGPAHGAGVLHFSLREGTAYADPARLFRTVPVVRLAPVDGPAPPVCPPPDSHSPLSFQTVFPVTDRSNGGRRAAATLSGDPAPGRESSRPPSHR